MPTTDPTEQAPASSIGQQRVGDGPLTDEQEAYATAQMITTSWFASIPAGVQRAYLRLPVWGFYESVVYRAPVRILAMHGLGDGPVRLTTVMVCDSDDTPGVALCEHDEVDVRRVDRWSDEHLARFARLGGRDAAGFTNPAGFSVFTAQ